MTRTTELLYDIKTTLGEGPVWDIRSQTLLWLDILEKKIYAGADIVARPEDTVGCVALREKGGLVYTQRASFWSVETGYGRPTLLKNLESERENNRFNDGKCDPRGRFIAGTMDLGQTKPTGALYSFDGDSVTTLLGGLTISNGMAWSPDGRTFYHIDTPTHIVRAFDYDPQTGAIANGRDALRIPEPLGWPDGMTVDAQGNLWIAMWGGAKLTKWNPLTGRLLEQIAVPAKNVTSCAFGGRNMNELFITSARKDLDKTTLNRYPLTGCVFRLVTEVEGLPGFRFAG